ncbi:MAG: zinc dependent phospholipase C family protein [Candidatus Aenigmatarchaeota archaeon]
MFTLLHALINYLFAAPLRKRIDITAFLLASILPDLEGLYYMPAAYAACGADAACAAAYPSHYALHSFFGIILIVAVMASIGSLLFKKRMKQRKFDMKIVYISALAGGLLHLLTDVTYHTGADALYLFWPAQTQYSFAFSGSATLWSALAAAGLFAFILLEKKNIEKAMKVAI